jgi:general secretion pathway protein K
MKTQPGHRPLAGFAIILVLLVITVLGMLAAGFALAMKVEIRLAANADNEAELEWLGRSGVELARYVLGQSPMTYSALNQIWAGGPGGALETNSVLMGIKLQDNELGAGRFSVRITDLERRFNINARMPEADKKAVMDRALAIMGVEAGDAATIEDSVLDWLDQDEHPHLNGTETDDYLHLVPPYLAKNGPIDDLAELLLVRGVTPEVYWGPRAPGHRRQPFRGKPRLDVDATLLSYPVGLVDLFTPLSNGRININTAPPQVIQLLPGMDEVLASQVIVARAGPDGAEGTEDDTPFMNPGAIAAAVHGLPPEIAARYAIMCTVQSSTFEVTVDASIANSRRTFVAVVRRNNARDLPVLQFSWR